MAPFKKTERRNFWEICEERCQTRSTLQVPVAQWREPIGDATIADGILDRLVHNPHRIELGANPCAKNAISPEMKSEESADPFPMHPKSPRNHAFAALRSGCLPKHFS